MRLEGAALEPYIPALAQLRMQVFSEYPYLYQGNLEYEARYLQKFVQWPHSTLVLVLDGPQVVGASTALPLSSAENEFQEPFVRAGYNLHDWYYFGESVLQAAYRGQGLGKRFFVERENRAKTLGYSCCTFCAVERPSYHRRKPAHYKPLDGFWQNQGYQKHPQLLTHFAWQDVGETQESAKPMVFWIKRLTHDVSR